MTVQIESISNLFNDAGSSAAGVSVLEAEPNALLFAQLIARTVRDIEILVDSLPPFEPTAGPDCPQSNESSFDTDLKQLDGECKTAGKKLENAAEEGQRMLKGLQNQLEILAKARVEAETGR